MYQKSLAYRQGISFRGYFEFSSGATLSTHRIICLSPVLEEKIQTSHPIHTRRASCYYEKIHIVSQDSIRREAVRVENFIMLSACAYCQKHSKLRAQTNRCQTSPARAIRCRTPYGAFLIYCAETE